VRGAQWCVARRKFFLEMATSVVVGLVFMLGAAEPSPASPGASELTVTVTWGSGLSDTWTLRCDPVGGTHPNRSRACALLNGLTAPFSAAPTGMACSMIYSGPERARVVGQWQGKPVDARFTRTDGCATARWRTYDALLTEPGVVTVRGRVDLGPTCPVQRPGESCEIVGAPATVTAVSGTSKRTVPSGPNGFSMRLPRATWTFTADAGMSCPRVVADLRLGHPLVPVIISCDTGIRSSARGENAS